MCTKPDEEEENTNLAPPPAYKKNKSSRKTKKGNYVIPNITSNNIFDYCQQGVKQEYMKLSPYKFNNANIVTDHVAFPVHKQDDESRYVGEWNEKMMKPNGQGIKVS